MTISADAHNVPLFLLPSAREPGEANAVTHHVRDRLYDSEPWKQPQCSSHSHDDQSEDDETSCDAPLHWAPKTNRRHIVPSWRQAQTLG
ncbi:hypothetical protein AB1Y20_000305 [Prymnesium parvum]|uniref:Uncharacterized protein n=1 Tax=Prymnesium parvum TaxID=97485 RepID=A0AB34K478_PRYPA